MMLRLANHFDESLDSVPVKDPYRVKSSHRLEEAEMRDHQKERKARTRRLIQEGAILEKALPQTTQMEVFNAAR